MPNGKNGWELLKNWGWALFLVVSIAVGVATILGHADDKNVHMTLQEKDSRYVPREIFQLEMEGIKRRLAEDRLTLKEISDKLDDLKDKVQ